MPRFRQRTRGRRRGIESLQTVVVLTLIVVAVLAGVRSLSTNTDNELDQTAAEIADPAKLAERFAK